MHDGSSPPEPGSPHPAEPAAHARSRRARIRAGFGARELVIDKLIDFLLIFIGLYAATALQRYQDTLKEKAGYVALLSDFQRELAANLAQEASIERDLGPIAETEPGKNLGPMAVTFDDFTKALDQDDAVVHCLHVEFAADLPGKVSKKDPAMIEKCHALYQKFDAAHSAGGEAFEFKPAALTPFYRYEVWQLYLADGVRTFRNKDLAVKIAEVYNNAKLVEKQIADIEQTFNDAFMVQVAKSAATDAELAQIVHDEEEVHGLSEHNQRALVAIMHDVKQERYGAKEARAVIELKVERMKKTALLMREEIADVTQAIDVELGRLR